MKDRRLYRSNNEKMLFGVCGGLAEYFDVDPTIVRALFAIAALLNGVGILLYIALAIIMPRPAERSSGAETGTRSPGYPPASTSSAEPPAPPAQTPPPESETPLAREEQARPAPEQQRPDEEQPRP